MNNPGSPETPRPHPPIKLGLNQGGYRGERLNVWETLARIALETSRKDWEPIPLNTPPDAFLPAYRRMNPGAMRNIYLSAGIHGDEPAGPLALLQLLAEDVWPDRFNYWIIPCLNPEGFELNTREDDRGVDLNRDYTARATARVRSHIRWFESQPNFDLALLLHEDWESSGFYLYELNPDNLPSLASTMVEAAARACPIDRGSQIDGRDAEGGMIRFVGQIPERAEWPEALWLIHNKSRHNYTLEAPSDFPLPARVAATTEAIRAALNVF